MSRPETLHTYALYMRAKASALRDSHDEETRRHASDLQKEADAIDSGLQAKQQEARS